MYNEPTDEELEYNGEKYLIKNDIMKGANTARMRTIIDIGGTRGNRARSIAKMAASMGEDGIELFQETIMSLMSVPTMNDILETFYDPDLMAEWLVMGLEPEVDLVKAKEIAQNYPNFAVLVRKVIKASGINAVKNSGNPLSEGNQSLNMD